ncbi:MAG: hypothetical protein KGI73_02915 [Patescibacteria group bacterium]|nr:hypothetical protein [Patescibacteria group bacterium]
MKPNPYLNAIFAAAYIVGIVFVIQAFTSFTALQKTLYIPIGMLGLLVLSAAVMSYLFGFEPFRLYFDNKKEDALAFFGRTVGTFAVILVAFLTYIFFFLH